MSRPALTWFVWATVCSVAAPQAAAAEPELKAIQPLGCSRGATIEITLSGSGFEQGGELYFDSPGITSEYIEKNRFRVTVSADSPLGDCDVWVATSAGLAGPRRFSVSDIPVLVEIPSNHEIDHAQPIPVPGIVDARFESADLDWFSFSGDAGQVVTISARSKSLDGTAQPTISLFGPGGQERAHSRAYRSEPMLDYRLPESGKYSLLLRDRAYRSNDASCYRLSIASGPRIAQALPHVVCSNGLGPSAENRDLTLLGFELPEGRPHHRNSLLQKWCVPLGTLEHSARQTCFLSTAAYMLEGSTLHHPSLGGAARIGLSTEPVVTEVENDVSSTVSIPVPCRVAGQFQHRSDVDRFRFSAAKDQVLQVEAFGERLDQWMDLEIEIREGGGKQLTVLRDLTAPKGTPSELSLGSLDAAGSWKAPADGEYDLVIRDLYGGSIFGPDRIYQLVLKPTAPAFHVVARVSDPKASRGLSLARSEVGELQLTAIRSGGFTGAIQVRAVAPPRDLAIDPCTIAEKEVTKTIKVKANGDASLGLHPLRLVAAAEIESDTDTCAVKVRNACQLGDGRTRLTAVTLVHIRD